MRFPSISDPKGGRTLLLALTGAAMLVYLALAFFVPLTLRHDPWVMQDDARQFLAWMPRISDAGAMRGNLIADYWQSVSPPLYRLPFIVLAWFGVAPPVTAMLLPAVLFPLTALALWPVALRLLGRPIPAFCGAALVMTHLIHEDSLYSSTPRALAMPLLLLFVRGFLESRAKLILIALTLMALIYPAPAITCLAMLGLSRLHLFPRPRIDFDRKSIMLVSGAALLVIGAGVSLRGEMTRWKPVLTFAQITSVPSMVHPGERGTVVQADGQIGWVCSQRMGYLPEIVPCSRGKVGLGGVINVLLFLPLLLLGWRAVRRHDSHDPDRIYALVIAATLICWSVAAIVLFKLHLPSRYSQRVLAPFELLALVRLIADLLAPRWNRLPQRVIRSAGAALLLPAFLTPLPKLKRASDAPAMAQIAVLPATARLAGVADELNLVPALTGHAVLATSEHDIPYHLGYYRPFHQRLRASVLAVTSPDPQVVGAFVRRYHVDVLVVDRAVLQTGVLPRPYRLRLPELKLAPARSALASAPCERFSGQHLILFDGACLADWAGTKERLPAG